MFKRPRNHKQSVPSSPQTRSKRLKEDSSSVHPQPRNQPYINVTYSGADAFHVSRQHESEAADTRRAEVNRYNRLKLQPGTRYESQMLHSCVNTRKSDSSSMTSEEATDSHEREHYNKLKVDMTQVQGNKKLQKGVQVLQTGKTHCCDRVADIEPKFRKEGHTLQMHSVSKNHLLQTPKPASLIPKSRSTGDMLGLDQGFRQASYNIPTHKLIHSRSTHDVRSITNSTSSSGSRSSSPRTTLHTSPVISLHTSPLTPLHSPASSPSFIKKMITFTCGHDGKEIRSTAYDFSVNIPKGTVRKKKSAAFKVGVCLQGPFNFPKGFRLVSPVLMVTCGTHSKLKKPIELALAHCIDILPQLPKNEGITFFRAGIAGENFASKRDTFEPTDKDTNHFELHTNHGKLFTTELGFFCIMTKEVVDARRKTNYCLVPVVPKSIESSSWKVHYCVTLHLQAHVKEIGDHFGPSWETLAPKPFKLETRVGTQNQEKVEINFERILPEYGWTLSLKSDSKIHTRSIDSWISKEGSTQPPHFTIRVSGNHATSAAMAPVWFTGPGMCQDLTMQINLPLKRTPPPTFYPSPNPTDSILSSVSSSSILLSSAMGSILSTSDYDHLPSREELDETHSQLTYHNGYIDFPTDEDLETVCYEVIRTAEEDWPKLQGFLDIPQYVMTDILNQKTTPLLQVFRLLREWRQHTGNSSKKELARCLRRADPRFNKAATILLQH